MTLAFHVGIIEDDRLLLIVPFGRKKTKSRSEQLDFSIMNQLQANNSGFVPDF